MPQLPRRRLRRTQGRSLALIPLLSVALLPLTVHASPVVEDRSAAAVPVQQTQSAEPTEPPDADGVSTTLAPRLFKCTDARTGEDVSPADVFLDARAVPLHVWTVPDSFTGRHLFDAETQHLQLSFSGKITWELGIRVRLGVKCKLNAPPTLPAITLAPAVELSFKPVLEFEVGASTDFVLRQTGTWKASFERTGSGAPTWDSSLDMNPIKAEKEPRVGASITAGLSGQILFGRTLRSKPVGLAVKAKLTGSFRAKVEGGCATFTASVNASLSVSFEAWIATWTAAEKTWDLFSRRIGVVCFTDPRIAPRIPAGYIGVSFERTLRAEDGRSGRWAVAPSTMPRGLVLDPLSGKLSGVPSGTPGNFNLDVTFTDLSGRTTSAPVAVTIFPRPTAVAELYGNIARWPDGTSFYVDLRGGRHPIADGGIFECLVAQGSAVRDVTSDETRNLPAYPDDPAKCVRAEIGDIIRTKDGDAYVLADGWVRRWIPDGNSYDCLRLNGHPVRDNVPRYYVMDKRSGADIRLDCANREAAKGHVVRADNGVSWYVDKAGVAHWIPDGGTFNCLVAQGKTAHPYRIPARLVTNFGGPAEDARCVRARVRDIIRAPGNDSYLINEGWTRSPIPDGGTFMCLNANGSRVVDVPNYYVRDLPLADPVTFSCYDSTAVKGKVVRSTGGLSYYVDKRGGKHWIPDGGTFDCIAAQTGGAYQYTVPRSWLTQPEYEHAQCVRAHPGELIRHADGDAYLVNANWTRSWIPSATVYHCLRADGRAVHGVPRYYIDDLTRADNAGVATGNCIVRRPDGTAFFVNNEGKREWIPDSPTWSCETGRGVPVVGSRNDIVDSIPEVGWHYCLNKASLHRKVLRHTDGDAHYIHPDDTRTWIPDEFTWSCRTRAGTPVVDTRWREYVNAFRDTGWDYCFDINTFKGRFIRHPDGDAHYVDDRGVRHWVPNGGTYNCLAARFGNPATVRWRQYVDRIPAGDWAVCGDTLWRNQKLDQGQWLQSTSGRYRLIMQTDGNLVLYNGGSPIWDSRTGGRPYINHLKLHDNGCLALIDTSGNWHWRPSPDPCGRGGDRLIVQNDGNLVLYAGGAAVWASNTAGR